MKQLLLRVIIQMRSADILKDGGAKGDIKGAGQGEAASSSRTKVFEDREFVYTVIDRADKFINPAVTRPYYVNVANAVAASVMTR